MTAYAGALVLIKIGDGGSPESFTTIGGLRLCSMTLGQHALDSSNVESGQWRQLMGSAGISSIVVSGGGIFTDCAAEESVRQQAFTGAVANYQFVFANGDRLAGPFLITAYQRSGNYDSEENYSLTLESAGNIIFTQA